MHSSYITAAASGIFHLRDRLDEVRAFVCSLLIRLFAFQSSENQSAHSVLLHFLSLLHVPTFSLWLAFTSFSLSIDSFCFISCFSVDCHGFLLRLSLPRTSINAYDGLLLPFLYLSALLLLCVRFKCICTSFLGVIVVILVDFAVAMAHCMIFAAARFRCSSCAPSFLLFCCSTICTLCQHVCIFYYIHLIIT